MIIRPYLPSDHGACLEVIKSNVPRDFLPSEVGDFDEFLLRQTSFNPECPYWVVEVNDAVVGCGGIGPSRLEPEKTVLIWGMVARLHQKNGLGKELLMHRLRYVDANWPEKAISLDTSQHAGGFFAKYGFELVSYQHDGYGPGLDKLIMTRPGLKTT